MLSLRSERMRQDWIQSKRIIGEKKAVRGQEIDDRRLMMLTRLAVIALVLNVTNTLAFSRCDKFSHAQNLAGSALAGSSLAGSIASNMVGRFFSRG